MRKKFDKSIILSALIISALIFLAGFSLGYVLNLEKIGYLENRIGALSDNLRDFQFQLLFFDFFGGNVSCPVLKGMLTGIAEDYEKIGSKLSAGPEDEIRDYSDFQRVLAEYYKTSINYWLMAEKVRDSCKAKFVTILFFISKSCEKYTPNPCDDQAWVLTYLKQKFDGDLLIFTISADVDEPSIQALKTYYNFTEFPSLVINGKKTFSGFLPLENLSAILCEYGLC